MQSWLLSQAKVLHTLEQKAKKSIEPLNSDVQLHKLNSNELKARGVEAGLECSPPNLQWTAF